MLDNWQIISSYFLQLKKLNFPYL